MQALSFAAATTLDDATEKKPTRGQLMTTLLLA